MNITISANIARAPSRISFLQKAKRRAISVYGIKRLRCCHSIRSLTSHELDASILCVLHSFYAGYALLLCSDCPYMRHIEFERVSEMFARLAQRINAYRSHRQTVDLLSRMEDHQLRDIGLNRGDIDVIAKGGRFAA